MSEHTGLKVKLKLPLSRKSDSSQPPANNAPKPLKRKRPEDLPAPHNPAQQRSFVTPQFHRPAGLSSPLQHRQSQVSDFSGLGPARPSGSFSKPPLSPGQRSAEGFSRDDARSAQPASTWQSGARSSGGGSLKPPPAKKHAYQQSPSLLSGKDAAAQRPRSTAQASAPPSSLANGTAAKPAAGSTPGLPTALSASQSISSPQPTTKPAQPASTPAAKPARPALPEKPATKEDMEKLLVRVQRQDKFDMFRYPVTEDLAPNYFKVVDRPMDFTTMHTKVSEGQYATWNALQADLDLMFDNCMRYNAADTKYHKQGQRMMAVAQKYVDLARQGITDARGRRPSLAGAAEKAAAATAKPAAAPEAPAAAGKAPAAPGKAPAAAHAAGHAPKHKGKSHHKESSGPKTPAWSVPEVDARNSHHPLWGGDHATTRTWGGLLAGTNAEGVPFHKATQLQPCFTGALPPDTYARSISRFAANLTGAARKLALARAALVTSSTPLTRTATAGTALVGASVPAAAQSMARPGLPPLPKLNTPMNSALLSTMAVRHSSMASPGRGIMLRRGCPVQPSCTCSTTHISTNTISNIM
ncbi:hypothetical protein WJX73_007083 [Symbiochloris irregularis]|uniref:Bromo domain-containing protein n=1 Tax=Symbiochloris irregularis TaxID=706552 RepID=A0AAW1NN28_9CHLO